MNKTWRERVSVQCKSFTSIWIFLNHINVSAPETKRYVLHIICLKFSYDTAKEKWNRGCVEHIFIVIVQHIELTIIQIFLQLLWKMLIFFLYLSIRNHDENWFDILKFNTFWRMINWSRILYRFSDHHIYFYGYKAFTFRVKMAIHKKTVWLKMSTLCLSFRAFDKFSSRTTFVATVRSHKKLDGTHTHLFYALFSIPIAPIQLRSASRTHTPYLIINNVPICVHLLC